MRKTLKDTWPQRIAIPTLIDSEKTLDWVARCLNTDHKHQLAAHKQLLKSLDLLRDSIAALKKHQ